MPEPVTALLLAEGGYAPLNPPTWIAHLRPQVVLLSVAAGDRQVFPFKLTCFCGRWRQEVLTPLYRYFLC